MNPVSASVYPTGTTAPTYLAQPGPALPVRTGVTTLRLGEGGGTPLGCTPCAAGAAGPAPPCVTPVITPGTAATTAEGVQVTTSSGARVYRPVVDGLIAHPPGATHAISTLPPTCDEDAILCNLLKGQHHYLNWHAGNPVYNVPSRALLPTGWENALNGFLPCTFDEHQYDDICSGCKKGGSCTSDKCKYKPGHFLITIEPSRTEEEKAYGPFVLAANGIRGRNIWLTRGKRYYFTFKACQLSVDPRLTIDGEPNPNAGLPLPPSSGGVKVTDEDIPLTFQNVSIIFSADNSVNLNTGTRIPIANSEPISLFGTGWLLIVPQMQTMFNIVGHQTSTTGTADLQAELQAAYLRVGVGESPTSKVPFPVA